MDGTYLFWFLGDIFASICENKGVVKYAYPVTL